MYVAGWDYIAGRFVVQLTTGIIFQIFLSLRQKKHWSWLSRNQFKAERDTVCNECQHYWCLQSNDYLQVRLCLEHASARLLPLCFSSLFNLNASLFFSFSPSSFLPSVLQGSKKKNLNKQEMSKYLRFIVQRMKERVRWTLCICAVIHIKPRMFCIGSVDECIFSPLNSSAF